MKPSQYEARIKLMYGLFGRAGNNMRIEPNIQISFGYNLEAGNPCRVIRVIT